MKDSSVGEGKAGDAGGRGAGGGGNGSLLVDGTGRTNHERRGNDKEEMKKRESGGRGGEWIRYGSVRRALRKRWGRSMKSRATGGREAGREERKKGQGGARRQKLGKVQDTLRALSSSNHLAHSTLSLKSLTI